MLIENISATTFVVRTNIIRKIYNTEVYSISMFVLSVSMFVLRDRINDFISASMQPPCTRNNTFLKNRRILSNWHCSVCSNF